MMTASWRFERHDPLRPPGGGAPPAPRNGSGATARHAGRLHGAARGGRTAHHAPRTTPRTTHHAPRARAWSSGHGERVGPSPRHAGARAGGLPGRRVTRRLEPLAAGLLAGHVTSRKIAIAGDTLSGGWGGVAGSVPAPRGGCAGTGEVSAGGRGGWRGRRRRPVPG